MSNSIYHNRQSSCLVKCEGRYREHSATKRICFHARQRSPGYRRAYHGETDLSYRFPSQTLQHRTMGIGHKGGTCEMSEDEASTLNEITWTNEPSSMQLDARGVAAEVGNSRPRWLVDKLSDVAEETERTISQQDNEKDEDGTSSNLHSSKEAVGRMDKKLQGGEKEERDSVEDVFYKDVIEPGEDEHLVKPVWQEGMKPFVRERQSRQRHKKHDSPRNVQLEENPTINSKWHKVRNSPPNSIDVLESSGQEPCVIGCPQTDMDDGLLCRDSPAKQNSPTVGTGTRATNTDIVGPTVGECCGGNTEANAMTLDLNVSLIGIGGKEVNHDGGEDHHRLPTRPESGEVSRSGHTRHRPKRKSPTEHRKEASNPTRGETDKVQSLKQTRRATDNVRQHNPNNQRRTRGSPRGVRPSSPTHTVQGKDDRSPGSPLTQPEAGKDGYVTGKPVKPSSQPRKFMVRSVCLYFMLLGLKSGINNSVSKEDSWDR